MPFSHFLYVGRSFTLYFVFHVVWYALGYMTFVVKEKVKFEKSVMPYFPVLLTHNSTVHIIFI